MAATTQPAANAAPRLLTSRELAEALHLHHVTVRKMTAAGLLPVIRIGRSVRYRLSDVLAHFEGGTK